MTFIELEKLLKKNGWYWVSSKGSHNHYRHKTQVGKLTVPNHKGDVPIGTLKSILKQASLEQKGCKK